MLKVTLVPILEDNYSYIIKLGDDVGIIDPGEAKPILDKLKKLELTPNYIFNTHHHYDHINGNEEIRNSFPDIELIGPAGKSSRIHNIDIKVNQNSDLTFGSEKINVIETKGHTQGHICFHFPQSNILFSGDTLFAMGCGRLFEGTPEDMFEGLSKIRQLPDETVIYCGHEYTETNGNFCLTVDTDNEALVKRMNSVRQMRAENIPTIPTDLAIEKQTNIFLRANTLEEFTHFRALRDNF